MVLADQPVDRRVTLPRHGRRYHRGAVVDRGDRGALVGRGAEEARLDAALEAAATGHGTTVIVGGEAGIGKTRLVGRVVATARDRGATVLSGACLAAGSGAIPYAPFVEALRELTQVGRAWPARRPARAGAERDRALAPGGGVRGRATMPTEITSSTARARPGSSRPCWA